MVVFPIRYENTVDLEILAFTVRLLMYTIPERSPTTGDQPSRGVRLPLPAMVSTITKDDPRICAYYAFLDVYICSLARAASIIKLR